jgi:outer membrane protein assembly factor BamB
VYPLEIELAGHLLYVRQLDRALMVFALNPPRLLATIPPPAARGEEGILFYSGTIHVVYGDQIYLLKPGASQPDTSIGVYFLGINGSAKPARTAVADGHLLAVLDNALSAYDLAEATLDWGVSSKSAYDLDLWPPAVGDGAVYLTNVAGQLEKRSLEDGQAAWSISLPDKPISPLVYARDAVYAVFSDGTVRSFSSRDGAETVIMTTTAYRYFGNDQDQYYNYSPGIASGNGKIIVSFGCRYIYALYDTITP